MLAQKLIVGNGIMFLLQIIQAVAGIIVARIAGPTVLGTFAFGMAFVSMFEFVAEVGFGTAHIKLISQGEDLGDCISTFFKLKIVNVFLFFIIVLGAFFIQKNILHLAFESKIHEYVIMVLLIAMMIDQLLSIPRTTFSGKTEQAKANIPYFVQMSLYQILRISIVVLGYKAVALAFGKLVATLLIVPFYLYLFKNYPRGRFNRALALKYVRIALPVLMIGISAKFIANFDKVALQYCASSAEVGYYRAGFIIGGIGILVANRSALLLFPLFSHAAARNNYFYIADIIKKFERFFFLFIMPVFIFLSLYSDVIVKLLFGNQYLPTIPIMTIITLAMFLRIINTPYGNVITGVGFFKLAAVLNFFLLFLFFSLMFVLLNPQMLNLGAFGAGIAVFITKVMEGILFRFFAKRKCPELSFKEGIKFILFGVINFSGFYFLYAFLKGFHNVNSKIIFVFIYFGITYGALALLGWIHKADIQNFTRMIDVRKMANYIQSEMAEKEEW